MIYFRSPLQGLCRAAVWSALVVLLVAGCGTAPVVEPPPPSTPLPVPPSVLGVAVIEPVSDVADLTEAVRHVLAPDGSFDSAPAALSGTMTEPTALPPSRSAGGTSSLPAPASDSPAALPADDDRPPRPLGEPNDITVAPSSGDSTPDDDGTPDAPPGPTAEGGDPAPSSTSDEVAASPTDPEPALQPGMAPQDEILAAWERYCVTTDLTSEQWGIIDRTAMPAVLRDRWAERCRPEK